ncbi:MAG: stage III sporulation protein AF [Lutispora sp.]|nr:stage III sporulation protein AF [Lutispora sp.]MDD4834376.1 stage III sporulation protein AF [Lutispora sp.]
MIEFLKPWVINIVIIILFVIITDIVLPDGSMKRYVRVIIGIFVLLAIIQPFIHIKDIKYDFEKSYIETSIILDNKNLLDDKEVLGKYQKIKALEIYEKNLTDKITAAISYKESISKNSIVVKLDINKDHQDSKFGTLNSVQVLIPKEEQTGNIEKIKKVEIGKEEKVLYKQEKEYNFNDKTSSDEIRDMLSKMLGINKDKVQVKLAVERD